MTLLVKCECCGYEFTITPEEICHGYHEDFVSCRNPQPYYINKILKHCSGCIRIPYTIDLREFPQNAEYAKAK